MPSVVTSARMSKSDWWLEIMIYDVPFRSFALFFISARTKDTASMMYAQIFERENARLPVRLNRAALMTGIARIMVVIDAHKKSHVTRIVLNNAFIAVLP
jgi:hypothetical protein